MQKEKTCSKHDEKKKEKKKIAHVQKKEKKERAGIIQKESIHLSIIYHLPYPYTWTS
jgi:hypothetical protein